jgi:hypothetical protein
LPILNTRQFLARRPGTDLARRKPGVQIPSPPPPTFAGQSVASVEPATLTAGCGRAAAASSSHSAAQRLSEASRPRPRPHTMTTQRGHHQLPSDGRSSRASSLSRSAWPSANHLPRRRPSPSRPFAGPARPAPASSARLQPRADDAPSWTWRATTPTPAIPSRTAAGPTATPRYLIAVGHRGHRDAQTPNAGHWTPGRSDARTGHRPPGQAPGGHRTLAPDTGHRMPDTNADTVTTPQPASGPSLAAMPSDRTLRRPPVLCPRTTRQPLGRLAGQAAPRRTAVVCWIWMVRVEGNGTTER